MKVIRVKEHEILVDDEDFELVNKYSWYIVKGDNTFYAYTDLRYWQSGMRLGQQYAMHRVILGLEKLSINNDPVDHINRNGLDNRKENLRTTTTQLNCFNVPPKHKNKSSQYKGVIKTGKKWNAQIKLNRKSNNLGTYEDEVYAARVYDAVVRFYTGEVGYVNFKEEEFLIPMSVETAKRYKHQRKNNGT